MYYPKNKVKTNLYTNGGEFTLGYNNENYIGYYHEWSNGALISGKTPNDIPNHILNKIPPSQSPPQPNSNYFKIAYPEIAHPFLPPLEENKTYFGEMVREYSSLIGKDWKNSPIIILPTSFYPQPQKEDYELSEFQRYFVKKTNEIKYVEIDKDQYDLFSKSDNSVAFQYYISFSYSWKISGVKEKVYQVNKNLTLLQEKRFRIRGLQEFLKEDYLKFHKYPQQNDLYTKGGELKDKNNVIYIGWYHVNETMGPMKGQYHTITPHDKLYFIEGSDLEAKLVKGINPKGISSPPSPPSKTPIVDSDIEGGGY